MTRPIQLVLLGLVIGANNLGAALALGALGQRHRRLRIVSVFAATEFTIPLVGLWVGQQASQRFSEEARWVGTALLFALGAFAIWSAWRKKRGEMADRAMAQRLTTWGGLVLLSLGLSIDNLLIGFSLGFGEIEPLVLAGTICLFSTAFSWVDLGLGSTARRHWERRAEIGAGVLLLGLAAANGMEWLG